MLPPVAVVTDRPRLRSRLEVLLQAGFHSSHLRLGQAPPSPAPPPTIALLDVLLLFPRPDLSALSDLPADLPRMVVVGSLVDRDAVLAAHNQGIPPCLLEDLSATTLAGLVGPAGSTLDLYLQLGRLWAEKVRRFLERSRERQALTRRETEILGLLSKGYTNPRIARALEIQPKTVSNHLSNAFSKLEVSNRYEAMALFAERCGPIPPTTWLLFDGAQAMR